MNCSTSHVLHCTVQGFPNTRVRSKWVCDHWRLCDGGEDEMCYKFTDDCYIHKHRLEDGAFQALSKSKRDPYVMTRMAGSVTILLLPAGYVTVL